MDRIYTIFAALEPSYESIRAQILASIEKLSFDTVTPKSSEKHCSELQRKPLTLPNRNPLRSQPSTMLERVKPRGS
jgi:hypothetical protein